MQLELARLEQRTSSLGERGDQFHDRDALTGQDGRAGEQLGEGSQLRNPAGNRFALLENAARVVAKGLALRQIGHQIDQQAAKTGGEGGHRQPQLHRHQVGKVGNDVLVARLLADIADDDQVAAAKRRLHQLQMQPVPLAAGFRPRDLEGEGQANVAAHRCSHLHHQLFDSQALADDDRKEAPRRLVGQAHHALRADDQHPLIQTIDQHLQIRCHAPLHARTIFFPFEQLLSI